MRIVLVGPKFHEYNESIARALQELECEVQVVSYKESELSAVRGSRYLPDSSSPLGRLRRNLLKRSSRMLRRTTLTEDSFGPQVPNMRTHGKMLQKMIEGYSPDILFVIKGTSLLPESLRRIKKKFPSIETILWAMDSITRFPSVVKGLEYYDSVYTYEPSDIPALEALGVTASYLPPGYDPSIYRPIANGATDRRCKWDLVFVGAGREDRFETIRQLVHNLSSENCEMKIGIFGQEWSQFRVPKEIPTDSRVKLELYPEDLPPEKVNEVFNASKICLNLHHSQSRMGLNPRTFEIPGSGSLQIVDRKNVLDKLFAEGKEVLSFTTGDSLTQTIISVLEEPARQIDIAFQGLTRARREHTYTQRLQGIVNHSR